MIVGQKVICIDDSINPQHFISLTRNFQQWIVKDKVYTIREIFHNDDIVTGVLLKEVKNKEIYIKLIDRIQEPAFADWRFRELDEFEEINEEVNTEELVTLSTLEQIAEEILKL